MPFRETGRMEERIRMFLEYESGNWSVSELCRRYGVCRDTFYEWRKRKESGDRFCGEENRQPGQQPIRDAHPMAARHPR